MADNMADALIRRNRELISTAEVIREETRETIQSLRLTMQMLLENRLNSEARRASWAEHDDA